MTTLEHIISRLRDLDDEKVASTSSRNIRSSPSSPATTNKNKRSQHMSPIRNILNSPLLNRRKAKKPQIDTSDEECNDDDHPAAATNGAKSSYHDLETFQKAQLRQKVANEIQLFFFHLETYSIIIHPIDSSSVGKLNQMELRRLPHVFRCDGNLSCTTKV